eukprot:Ihof_evm8s101 gene=Ihof_evmTU8s101
MAKKGAVGAEKKVRIRFSSDSSEGNTPRNLLGGFDFSSDINDQSSNDYELFCSTASDSDSFMAEELLKSIEEFLCHEGIIHLTTLPYAMLSHGLSKKMVHQPIGMAKTALLQANMPATFYIP